MALRSKITPASGLTLRQWRNLRHLALDLDGTLYRGATLFPETLPFLRTLERCGIGCTFLTNNSSRSRLDYLKKLRVLGLPVRLDQILTSTMVTLDYIRHRHPRARRLLVLGTASLRAEVRRAGYIVLDAPALGRAGREPDLVLVGFDLDLTYARLCSASWWISRGKPFIATHLDRLCPTDAPTLLVDCGAICAALTTATGIASVALGKPNPEILYRILRAHRLKPAQLAMVGDRLYTDIAMASAARVPGLLVLSGESTRADARACATPPTGIFKTVGEIAVHLTQARHP